jgi:hypothetical protein
MVFESFDGGRGMRSMRKREVVCGSAIEQKFRFRWEEKKQKRVGLLKLSDALVG